MSDEAVLKFEPEVQVVFDKKGGESPVQTILKLTNTSKALDVLFRVQTTSPATYRVRPSHGRIPAGSHVEIQVMMVTDPVRADKFLIKYVTVAHSLPQGEFMKQFQEAEGSAQEHRLRVMVGEGEQRLTPGSDRDSPVGSQASSTQNIADSSLAVELKEAKNKIQLLVAKNQELTSALEDAKGLRKRLDTADSAHPATKLQEGISETELNSLISAQAGFPPILVILIALFSFLLGLLF